MKCPVCGADTAEGAFCEFCGSPLEAKTETASAAPVAAATAATAATASTNAQPQSSGESCPVCEHQWRPELMLVVSADM